jgi:hypothetical protein
MGTKTHVPPCKIEEHCELISASEALQFLFVEGQDEGGAYKAGSGHSAKVRAGG